MLEWAAVAVLLLGMAVATAGIIAIVLDGDVARILIPVGAVIAIIGGIAWTVVVKVTTRRARSTA